MPTAPKDSRKSAAPPASPQADRQERLAQALRDNLKKRKAQQRERQDTQRERQDARRGPVAPPPGGDGDGGGRDGGGGDAS